MRRTFRAQLANYALLLIGCLVTVLGFEITLRLFLPQRLYRFPRGFFRNDKELVFSLTPNSHGVLHQPEFSTHYRINSLGLRGSELGPKSHEALRVLGVGDSFVSALNVEEEDTFLSVAGRRIQARLHGRPVEIVNAGTPNYATWHELRQLHKLLPLVQPDAVLLCVYVGNDVQGNLAPGEAVVADGFLTDRSRTAGILPYEIRSWLQRNSMAYVLLWYGWNEVRPWFGRSWVDPLGDIKELASIKSSARMEEGYKTSGQLLGEFGRETRAHDCPLLVVLIPAELQVYPAPFMQVLKREELNPKDFDLDLPNSRWRDAAHQQNIPVLDLLPVFRSHVSGPKLYMSLDGHLTKEGNELAGETIGDTIASLLSDGQGP